jgi:hypothetical protein
VGAASVAGYAVGRPFRNPDGGIVETASCWADFR